VSERVEKENPQKIGIPFHALANVVDQTMAMNPLLDVTKSNKSIIHNEASKESDVDEKE